MKEVKKVVVNGWTDYSEIIGDTPYFVFEDGYKMFHIELFKNHSTFPTSWFIVGSIEQVEEILQNARLEAQKVGECVA